MLVCECGREFKRQCDLTLHKKYCKGKKRYCKNPECKKLLIGAEQKQYCSTTCSAKVNTPGRKHSIETRNKISKSQGGRGDKVRKFCLNCNSELLRSQMKFCDVNCQTKYNRDILIDRWLKDPSKFESTPSCVRWWFINKYGEKCMICGWNEINPYTKKIPLELHHINGNWKNNYPDNIEMICANCHTLTPTYRGANRGKGREWSKEYYRGKTTRK